MFYKDAVNFCQRKRLRYVRYIESGNTENNEPIVSIEFDIKKTTDTKKIEDLFKEEFDVLFHFKNFKFNRYLIYITKQRKNKKINKTIEVQTVNTQTDVVNQVNVNCSPRGICGSGSSSSIASLRSLYDDIERRSINQTGYIQDLVDIEAKKLENKMNMLFNEAVKSFENQNKAAEKRYNDKIEYIKEQYDNKVEYINDQCNNKIENVKEKFENKVEYMIKKFEDKIHVLENKHENLNVQLFEIMKLVNQSNMGIKYMKYDEKYLCNENDNNSGNDNYCELRKGPKESENINRRGYYGPKQMPQTSRNQERNQERRGYYEPGELQTSNKYEKKSDNNSCGIKNPQFYKWKFLNTTNDVINFVTKYRDEVFTVLVEKFATKENFPRIDKMLAQINNNKIVDSDIKLKMLYENCCSKFGE